MSSIAASLSVANHALYCASKSANEGLARSFAADGGPRRITCNAIAPGGIKTDMFAQNAWHYSPGATKDTPIEEIEAGIAKLIPLNRCAVPDDIAKVVMFLCHDDSEWVTGKFLFSKDPKILVMAPEIKSTDTNVLRLSLGQTIRLTGGSTIA